MARTRKPQRPVGLARRSFRVADDTYGAVKARAMQENVSIAYVLSVLAEGYGRELLDLPKHQLIYGSGTIEKDVTKTHTAQRGEEKTRSFQVDYDTWVRFAARADKEGVTYTYVLTVLSDGYAQGLIDLPKKQLVYPTGIIDKE